MITGVHISSSEMVITKDDGKKSNLPQFKKNQIIKAKVLQLLPKGKALLLVNGQKITAKTSMLLKPGEEVQLQVLKEKDSIILKLIGPLEKMTTKQVSSLVSFFSNNKSIPDIGSTKIQRVKELLYEMALKSEKADKNFLPKLIEKSGVVWEKKLAQILVGNKSAQNIKSTLPILFNQDLKGNIQKEIFMESSQQIETLKVAANFSETIENFQLLNHQNSDSGRFLLPFPIFSESAFSFGQLLIDTGDKTKTNDKDKDKLVNISFLLNMTQLGPLRADFSILKKEITGRFLLKDDETCDYVRSMVPELKTRLLDVEYNVRKIDCSTAKKEEIQESVFIESMVTARDDSVLNIVI